MGWGSGGDQGLLITETKAIYESRLRDRIRGIVAYTPSLDRPKVLDLRDRWLDVRRMAKSHGEYRSCLRAGWDPDDLDSEVYARCLARQDMASRYDPARAGVGKYLFTLTRTILLNLLDLRASEKGRAEVAAGVTLERLADRYDQAEPGEESSCRSVVVPLGAAPGPVRGTRVGAVVRRAARAPVQLAFPWLLPTASSTSSRARARRPRRRRVASAQVPLPWS